MSIKVKDLMSPNPIMIDPNASLKEAAQKMRLLNFGFLLVGTPQDLKGVITDRDIVMRAVSEGKNMAHEKVVSHMSPHHYACNENDEIKSAAEKMHQYKVTRLVVINNQGEVTGVLSFGSLFRNDTTVENVCDLVKNAFWNDFYDGDTHDKFFA